MLDDVGCGIYIVVVEFGGLLVGAAVGLDVGFKLIADDVSVGNGLIVASFCCLATILSTFSCNLVFLALSKASELNISSHHGHLIMLGFDGNDFWRIHSLQ